MRQDKTKENTSNHLDSQIKVIGNKLHNGDETVLTSLHCYLKTFTNCMLKYQGPLRYRVKKF